MQAKIAVPLQFFILLVLGYLNLLISYGGSGMLCSEGVGDVAIHLAQIHDTLDQALVYFYDLRRHLY